MSTAATRLLTAEEFGQKPDPGYPEELVRGRIVALPPPKPRHGQICSRVVLILGTYASENDLGHVLCNDSGVITERNPDTVRGADIAYYSYDRLPRGPLPDRYGPEVPELVIEVRSPGDRWPQIFSKVAEYLEAGVLFVAVLDDSRRMAHVFDAEGAHQMLGPDDDLTFPTLLGEFRVPVRRFFE